MNIDEFEKQFKKIKIDEEEKFYNNKRAALVFYFIENRGIKRISSKELDRMIDIYGENIFRLSSPKITDIYDIVSSRESNKKITRLTWGMFAFALITTVTTIYSLFM